MITFLTDIIANYCFLSQKDYEDIVILFTISMIFDILINVHEFE